MIRELIYTVTENTRGITPNTIQWGGMQYEDNATMVTFDLSALDLTNALCRIDFNSDGAGYHPSENLTLNNGKISREIPKYITQYGGELQVTAVVTRSDTGEVVYSYPVKIRFTAVEKNERGNETVEGNISKIEESVQIMAEKTEENTKLSQKLAAEVSSDRLLTEEARFALEDGSEFIFVGGDAENCADATLVVDSEMSNESRNPVQNKTVKAYIDSATEETRNLVNDVDSKVDRSNTKIGEIETQVNLQVDYIVEQGTLGGWVYRKWNSGIAECWGEFDKITEAPTVVDGEFIIAAQLPFEFKSRIPAFITGAHNAWNFRPWYDNAHSTNSELTRVVAVTYSRTNTLQANSRVSIVIEARGTWK